MIPITKQATRRTPPNYPCMKFPLESHTVLQRGRLNAHMGEIVMGIKFLSEKAKAFSKGKFCLPAPIQLLGQANQNSALIIYH